MTGPAAAPGDVLRRRVAVQGLVQGVGFRPFVFALAAELGLSGHVTNTGDGVLAEVEGAAAAVDAFCLRVAADAPPLADVVAVRQESVRATGARGFAIVPSSRGRAGRGLTLIPPDTATCDACLAELRDPADRRHRHPFITCTDCGPRFTIVTALPYDRAHTTMAGFPMCRGCAREYADPADRRFHAQPVSCHDCGPQLSLAVPGEPERDGEAALAQARRMLAAGAVLAVKGIGGYHLACDASDARAVALLRRRKNRGDKPFALMARALADVEPLVCLGPEERRLLTGPARPVVLLRRRPGAPRGAVAESVAPRSPDLGVMLPYTPLHHLLLGLDGDPDGPRVLVMTSGNLAGEPIVTDDAEARERLAPLVDGWLAHDRPIRVPCDDSVVRVVDGVPLPVRRSRGYVPAPVRLPVPVAPVFAAGGDLKNVFALAEGDRAWLSGHIGDMDDLATLRAFDRAVDHLTAVTGVTGAVAVADRHPGYRSARRAGRSAAGRPPVRVQHHHAHVSAAMAENGLDGTRPVIGVAFDGTGYGDDGTVWGGEVLIADYGGFLRFAHLEPVPLPGGDAAVVRPYRMALSHLRAAGIPWTSDLPPVAACPDDELRVLERQLATGLHCVPTSSMGRLFDAVSSLAGVCHRAGYEAQAAIELEAAAYAHGPYDSDGYGYGFALREEAGGRWVAGPAPVLAAAVADLRSGAPPGRVAARFHAGVAVAVRRLCGAARDRHGLDTVALTGGVFGNALLLSACARGLAADGFTVLRHRRVPPNDGGLALGQLMVAARATAGEETGVCAWRCPAE
ncbi:carbamoyltransferase HypF [Streptomyces yaizuensis]|uniref:Carbamoyltransferase n=1 Tax=Streptomyces yaizuensis TaxID=2989713 RepID=A0ABQ5NYG7_9ACTN|nr:carbamoyltransferase HypF [Streptomyces sp. YSPA8]GLF95414.1 carbamoyltransferase HypF [Streptomyces sp. YSPA8]